MVISSSAIPFSRGELQDLCVRLLGLSSHYIPWIQNCCTAGKLVFCCPSLDDIPSSKWLLGKKKKSLGVSSSRVVNVGGEGGWNTWHGRWRWLRIAGYLRSWVAPLQFAGIATPAGPVLGATQQGAAVWCSLLALPAESLLWSCCSSVRFRSFALGNVSLEPSSNSYFVNFSNKSPEE